MTFPALQALLFNVALVLALVLIFDLLAWKNWVKGDDWRKQVIMGLLLGVIITAVMAAGITVEGARLDARTVLLAIVGLYFGIIPTLLTVLAAVLFRTFYLGGVGVILGIFTILSSAGIGMLCRRYWKNKFSDLGWRELLFLGITVHVVMFFVLNFLPVQSRWDLWRLTGFTILLVYPVATVALGLMLSYRLRFNESIKALQASEAHNRQLSEAVEQSPVTIMMTDTDGHIEYVNQRFTETTGYTLEEVLGRNPRFLKTDDQETQKFEQLWAKIKEGKSWRGEFRNRRKDGTIFWESAYIAPMFNHEGKITHFLGIKEDISRLKEQSLALEAARDAAEKASRAKSEFLGLLSHELRTPLNQITGPCDLMAQTITDPETVELVQMAKGAAGRLLTLVDRILTFSELDLGTLNFEVEIIDTRHFLGTALKAFETAATNRGIDLRMVNADKMPSTINFDRAVLLRIIHILIENEVKFASPGPVSMGFRKANESSIEFFISDTGPGIPAESLKTIFEPFRQSDMSSRRAHEGVGIGLAIASQLARLSGGDLRVASAHGHGSTFVFRFPAL
jgi:PAS domain S-box-containing protein